MNKATLIRKVFNNIPLGVSGLALGITGITGAWTAALGHKPISIIGIVIACLILSALIIKYIIFPDIFLKELKDPVLSTALPTMDMTLMVIAALLVETGLSFGKVIWFVSILIHMFFLISFIYYQHRSICITKIMPNWFVPPVGIVVACVTGSEMGFPNFSQILFYFGLICTLILLPIMLYRMMFSERPDVAHLPTFAVIASPVNLCLIAYLVIFPNPDYLIASKLIYLGIFTTLLVYISFFKIFRLNFSPLFSSFAFPLGVSTTAAVKYTLFLEHIPFISLPYLQAWETIYRIELLVTSLIILYIFIQMILFIKTKIKQHS
ncbi:MAG: TDT family transporter [Brevinemataceae bacterium]